MLSMDAGPARAGRYSVQDEPGGRFLYCREAPEVKVKIERGKTVTAAAARKAAEGTIFLDGVAQCEPFLDAERRVFNLDHHTGCVRAFTLSTCEQALVLVLRGLDLKERPWTLCANEPDLDTVLAIWVLLNSMHLTAAEPQVRLAAVPLVRLEGILDVHGAELSDLAGLPPPELHEAQERLAALRQTELALKREGSWESADPLEFTAGQLRALDSMIYPAGYFHGFLNVEVLARAELSDHRVAVVCRSEQGIYETEADLKRLYGKRLGIVALQKDPRTYTLRQVDPFLPATLDAVYVRLNTLDPAVHAGDGNRWGGSGEIGGSPRQSGTRLSPQEIAATCAQAFRKPTVRQRVAAVGLALLASVVALAGGEPPLAAHWRLHTASVFRPLHFALGTALVSLLLLFLAGRRRPRLYGGRLPGGSGWLWTLPVALLGGLAGGTWTGPTSWPTWHLAANSLTAERVGLFLALPLAAELTFRALAHGILARAFAIQHDGGRWFLSWPTVLQALFYTLATPLALLTATARLPTGWVLALPLAGALLFGLAAGVARERSGSALAPLLLHWLSAFAAGAAMLR
ncbi:MAG TPA: hypothetical protein VGK45_14285 [Thermoanaerobaculia bacterium]